MRRIRSHNAENEQTRKADIQFSVSKSISGVERLVTTECETTAIISCALVIFVVLFTSDFKRRSAATIVGGTKTLGRHQVGAEAYSNFSRRGSRVGLKATKSILKNRIDLERNNTPVDGNVLSISEYGCKELVDF